MRKYITLFFSVSLFLFACNSGKPSAEIINHDRMVNLLTDLHIVDGRMYTHLVPDSLYKYGMGMYLSLFKKYNTDSVQFRKSYKYYTTQPAELQAIYEQVLKNLKQKTDSVTKLQLKQAQPTQPTQPTQQKPLNALPKK
ncbi:MAG TPA: DUF4296 domain-containing protein [Mucilaginibacter sp.]|jgi:hypothetical protein